MILLMWPNGLRKRPGPIVLCVLFILLSPLDGIPNPFVYNKSYLFLPSYKIFNQFETEIAQKRKTLHLTTKIHLVGRILSYAILITAILFFPVLRTTSSDL